MHENKKRTYNDSSRLKWLIFLWTETFSRVIHTFVLTYLQVHGSVAWTMCTLKLRVFHLGFVPTSQNNSFPIRSELLLFVRKLDKAKNLRFLISSYQNANIMLRNKLAGAHLSRGQRRSIKYFIPTFWFSDLLHPCLAKNPRILGLFDNTFLLARIFKFRFCSSPWS